MPLEPDRRDVTERIRERYEPLETVATCARGTVVRAMDHQHGHEVAIKIRPVRSAEHRQALQGETHRLVALPPSPELPLVREGFFEGESHYLVTDWIAGLTLLRILEEKVDPGLRFTAIGYLRPVAAALDHLHRQHPPVVHGDVRPQNVVVTMAGQVVLVGFGSAGETIAAPELRGYRAPELATGSPLAPAADHFGLAATALWLLQGAPPGDPEASLRSLPRRAQWAIQRVVKRAMTEDPAGRRVGSAGELIERLGGWMEAELPTGTVTFLLSDIEGSTRMWEAEAESMSVALSVHDDLVADVVERHGGMLVKTRGEGDSTFSVFERAGAAVRAAVELRAALEAQQWPTQQPIRVRMVLHTGEAEVREGDYYGPVVNRCARLRAIATGGQVLVSDATHELVRDQLPAGTRSMPLGQYDLKDLARAEDVFLLLREGEEPPAAPVAVPSREEAAGQRRRFPIPVPLTLVFALILGAIGFVATRGGGDDAQTQPPALQLVADTTERKDPATGVTIKRTWTFEPTPGGPILHGFLRIINFEDRDVRGIVVDEVFPPTMAASREQVVFDPSPEFLLSERDPLAVRYHVKHLVAKGLRSYEYTVRITALPSGPSAAILQGWFEEEDGSRLDFEPPRKPPGFPGRERAQPVRDRIVIDGSGTVFLITDAIAPRFEAVNPTIKVDVSRSGTRGGFEKFCEGLTDVQDASSAIDDREGRRCRRNGISFLELVVAHDGVTVIASEEAEWAMCLTIEELRRIWEPGSDLGSWANVRPGFPDVPLSLFGPRPTAGTYDFFTTTVTGAFGSRTDYQGFADFNRIAEGVAEAPGGLGYFGYPNYLENQEIVQAVGIDGGAGTCVAPSEQTVRDGSYAPLVRPLYLYVNLVALEREGVRIFLNYVLDEVAAILPDLGFTPIEETLRDAQKARVAEATV